MKDHKILVAAPDPTPLARLRYLAFAFCVTAVSLFTFGGLDFMRDVVHPLLAALK